MDFKVLLGATLVVIGAFFLAIYNSWKGKLLKSDRATEDQVLLINMLGSGVLLLAVGIILPIYGNKIAEYPAWLLMLAGSMPIWVVALVATGILNIGIQFFNNAALKREDTSLVTPLSSATPVLLILMSYLILGQWPSVVGRWGMSAVAVGAYLLYLKGKPVDLPVSIAAFVPENRHAVVGYYLGPWIRIFQSRGAQLALLSAYLGSISINFDAVIVLELNPAAGPGAVALFVGAATFAYMAATAKLRSILSDTIPWKELLTIVVVYALSVTLMSSGYLFMLAPYAGALKRTQILFTVLIATLWLGEAYARDRIIGASIITAGVVLITLWP